MEERRMRGVEKREGENGSKNILIIEESIKYSLQWKKIDPQEDTTLSKFKG